MWIYKDYMEVNFVFFQWNYIFFNTSIDAAQHFLQRKIIDPHISKNLEDILTLIFYNTLY